MDSKLSSSAAVRNTQPLIEALAPRLPAQGLVLELASGPGQHAAAFAERFPHLDWQPSDADPLALASITAWRADAALANLREPLALDLAVERWWQAVTVRPDAAVAVNVTHIAPWRVTEGLFAGVAALLPKSARFHLYGPFFEEGVQPAPSNLSFDRSLGAQDPAWGLRRVEDLEGLAARLGLAAEERLRMPANNLFLSFRAA